VSDKRKVRFEGVELGPLSLDRLYRMVTRGEIGTTAEFWSDRQKQWLPLAGILVDIEPSRIGDMKSAGIRKVKILGSGPDDCPACMAIQEKVYPVDQVPILPPADCACNPWCRCVEIATE
jgi:GYF domain 2